MLGLLREVLIAIVSTLILGLLSWPCVPAKAQEALKLLKDQEAPVRISVSLR